MEFRLRDFGYPLDIFRLRGFLAEIETWPPERQTEWQTERLRALLAHARATCPYYRRLLDQAGLDPARLRSPEDLRVLPVLTKDAVRAHETSLCSTEAARHDPRAMTTSGSTGTALRFLLDRHTNTLEFATLWRQFNRAGYRFGERFADLRGHLVGSPDGIERDLRLNALNLSAFDFGPARVRPYAEALAAFRPVMVRGYPSSIALLSAWALETDTRLPSPRAVVTSSETLLETQRRVIERAFRAPVHDYYGQTERVAFAGQCPAGAYHVAWEYGVVEILDAAGRPVAPGVPGRLIATGLHHRAMPFIRYETRDVATWSTAACTCGRTSPVLARIEGRLEDVVVTPDGRHVGRLDAAFKHSPGIRLAQVVQEQVESIRVRIVPGAGYSARDEEKLVEELRARLGDAIAIDIERVADLPLSSSGKLKFVVSRLAAPAPGGTAIG